MCEEAPKANENEPLMAAKRLYEQCLDIRNFEISQLANRNNFLMIFQGVLFAGLVQSSGTFPVVSFMACLTGIVVSWFQTQIAAGAKYWQEHWEYELKEAEIRLLGLLPVSEERTAVKLFSKSREQIKNDVQSRLEVGTESLIIRALILKKYSVSKVPIKLGLSLMGIWTVLLLCTVNFGWCITVPDFITGFKR